MAKVLYLSYDGMTDPLGQSQVIPYLVELSKSGHQFHLISFEKRENRKRIISVSQYLKEKGIHWHPLTYHKSPPVISTVFDLWRMYKKAREIIVEVKMDFIHSRSYPPSLVALALKKRKAAPFIFDMRGFWADERVEGNLWSLTNPVFKAVYRFFKRKEKELLASADEVVSLTENARQWIIAEWNHNEGIAPVTVIPCCCDTALFQLPQPDRKSAAKNELQIPQNSFVLGYVGSIGTWYLLEEMLQFFKCLLQFKPDACFLFITLKEHEFIRKKAAEHQVHNLKIISADRHQVAYYLNAVDASVYFIKPSFSKKASSPVKQAELMASGIPSITNRGIGDTDLFFADETPGLLIKDFSRDEFMRAAEELVKRKFNPEAIRQMAIEHFTIQKGAELYAKIYDRLMAKINDGISRHA